MGNRTGLGEPMVLNTPKERLSFDERKAKAVEAYEAVLKVVRDQTAGLPDMPCSALGIVRNNFAFIEHLITSNIKNVGALER